MGKCALRQCRVRLFYSGDNVEFASTARRYVFDTGFKYQLATRTIVPQLRDVRYPLQKQLRELSALGAFDLDVPEVLYDGIRKRQITESCKAFHVATVDRFGNDWRDPPGKFQPVLDYHRVFLLPGTPWTLYGDVRRWPG